MKSSKLLPIFAFVFFFSLLFFQSVFADFDTERFITVKAVITFEHSATEAQVTLLILQCKQDLTIRF